MSEVKLVELLTLDKIEEGLFRGQSWDLGFRALFGGQVLGQALAAAQLTLPEGRITHSFHSYFLLPGDANKPVIFDVENVRDGRSFSTRRIKAIQNGRNIFYMTASFQTPEKGLEHQYADMPNVPPPEDITSDIKVFGNNQDKPGRMCESIGYHKPIDMRTVDYVDPAKEIVQQPKRYIWMKAQEVLSGNINLNQVMLAYASDYHLLSTALHLHWVSTRDEDVSMPKIYRSKRFNHDSVLDEMI